MMGGFRIELLLRNLSLNSEEEKLKISDKEESTLVHFQENAKAFDFMHQLSQARGLIQVSFWYKCQILEREKSDVVHIQGRWVRSDMCCCVHIFVYCLGTVGSTALLT